MLFIIYGKLIMILIIICLSDFYFFYSAFLFILKFNFFRFFGSLSRKILFEEDRFLLKKFVISKIQT